MQFAHGSQKDCKKRKIPYEIEKYRSKKGLKINITKCKLNSILRLCKNKTCANLLDMKKNINRDLENIKHHYKIGLGI